MDIILNRLEIIGKDNQINKIREFIKTPNRLIDFNNIIANPNEECSDWNYKIWHTKWNAFYQESPKPNIIEFSTSNYPVPYLMRELSKKFPNVVFLYFFDLAYVIIDLEVCLFIKNGIETEIPQNYLEAVLESIRES